ncbi:outer membrane beta-barrel protein [Acinetobacter sp. ESL0695]|jgi:outer membrane protein|nr:OmpW family outer membrane protein [Acinetobacter sp. ESL0695]WEV48735.1 outer membrane beta-barrel protein [Acinetobacter sp. ESL0695]
MIKKALFIALVSISSASFAGNFQVKIGASALVPSEDNNTLANGAVPHVKADTAYSFTPSIEYFFTNTNISTELLLATPFKHDVTSNGTKIASFKHLPPTLTVKYNFNNVSQFTPYVGIGATAVLPFSEKTTGPIAGHDLDAKVAYGVAGQIGFNFKPKQSTHWGLFADVRYANVKSKLKLDGNNIGDLKVNPWVYTLGYSYHF